MKLPITKRLQQSSTLGVDWTLWRVSYHGLVRYLPLTLLNSTVGNESDLYVPMAIRTRQFGILKISHRHGL